MRNIATVAAMVIRKYSKKGVHVLTQTRKIINERYDTFYNNTEEVCGETLNPWESIMEGAIRGCQEELGVPDFKPLRIVGGDCETVSTNKDDLIVSLVPYLFVQQLKGPQPWLGPAFVFIASSDFEPKGSDETSGYKWWFPKELSEELKNNPEKFMGRHYPILLKVCEDLIAGRIKF